MSAPANDNSMQWLGLPDHLFPDTLDVIESAIKGMRSEHARDWLAAKHSLSMRVVEIEGGNVDPPAKGYDSNRLNVVIGRDGCVKSVKFVG